MADTFTTITHQSWGSRLRGSSGGVCCGVVFVFLGICFLFWNEGNAVAAHESLAQAAKLCEDLPSIDTVDTKNENKLVHVTGFAKAESDVSDATFGLSLADTIKLKRTVEMYQWVEDKREETAKNAGGSTDRETVYTYRKEWRSHVVLSSNFDHPEEHENAKSMPFTQFSATADPVTLGAFTLSAAITSKINWFRPLTQPLSVDSIPEATKEGKHISSIGSGFYVGTGSESNPHINDAKVVFSKVAAQTVSIVARQTADTFSGFQTKNGRTVLLVEPGVVDSEQMFVHANKAVTFVTWVLRIVGLLVLWASFHNIARPLSVFADVLPFLGNCLEGINCVLSGGVAMVVWAVTIAVAWMFYRPFLSLTVFALVGGLVFFLVKQQRSRVIPTAYVAGDTEDLEMNDEDDLELANKNTATL